MDIVVFIVVALVVLALVDLMVGVANDAVNFLNSAIGSNAAPRVVIMLLASAGIIVGVTFSSGLMEVARKGIFDPSFFTLNEIMFVFLAVMITDVLLLDFYNTLGLPTSTTVSIVFELLGAAIAIAAWKSVAAGDGFAVGFTAINSASVLKIISGILLSVVVAFTIGAIAQWLTRLLFTFDYMKRITRYGALWGALAITAISFFAIIKGAKGASFITKETSTWILDNTWMLAAISYGFWLVVLQIAVSFFKVNIFKPIILAGTFALAMAFAANDLVNFIGAPLAGINSYTLSLGSADPLNMNMAVLAEKVRANTWYLLAAGLVMVVTLWLNKKARSVTRTEINLGRQDEGHERFQSIAPARGIVRTVLVVFQFISSITPANIREKVNARFDTSKTILLEDKEGNPPSFDLVRASVNLMIAAILISIGTILKLPLSTTYVTFTVAMATALPDRAWGRESAVYRVSGVLTVISGWFMTAFFAATASFLVGTAVYYGELPAMIILIALAGFLLYRTYIYHRKREKEEDALTMKERTQITSPEQAKDILINDIGEFINNAGEAVNLNTKGLFAEDRVTLKSAKKIAKNMTRACRTMTTSIVHTSRLAEDEDSEFDQMFANAIGALQRLSNSVKNLTYQSYVHVDNNHNLFNDTQNDELRQLDTKLQNVLKLANVVFQGREGATLDDVHEEVAHLKEMSRKFDKNQLKRTKKEKYPSRTSLLFFEILSDTNAIVDNLLILLHVSASYKPEDDTTRLHTKATASSS